jgi:hypothetical protein
MNCWHAPLAKLRGVKHYRDGAYCGSGGGRERTPGAGRRRAIGGGAEIGVAVGAGRFAAKSVSLTDSAAAILVARLLDRSYGRREEKGGAVQHRPRVIAAVLKGDADADCYRDRYRT